MNYINISHTAAAVAAGWISRWKATQAQRRGRRLTSCGVLLKGTAHCLLQCVDRCGRVLNHFKATLFPSPFSLSFHLSFSLSISLSLSVSVSVSSVSLPETPTTDFHFKSLLLFPILVFLSFFSSFFFFLFIIIIYSFIFVLNLTRGRTLIAFNSRCVVRSDWRCFIDGCRLIFSLRCVTSPTTCSWRTQPWSRRWISFTTGQRLIDRFLVGTLNDSVSREEEEEEKRTAVKRETVVN